MLSQDANTIIARVKFDGDDDAVDLLKLCRYSLRVTEVTRTATLTISGQALRDNALTRLAEAFDHNRRLAWTISWDTASFKGEMRITELKCHYNYQRKRYIGVKIKGTKFSVTKHSTQPGRQGDGE